MSRIKYIDSNSFFAKEYRDGIIVAFADISGDKLLLANQIHKIINSNIDNELFVSDIVKLLDVNDLCKHNVQNSLCVFNKQGVSISACGIQTTFYKDLVHVTFERRKVLIIKRRKTRKFLKCFFLVVAIISICNLLVPEEDINNITDELEIEIISDTETDIITNNATTLPISTNNDFISTTPNDECETATVVDIDSSLAKNETGNNCWEDSVAMSDNSSTIVDEIIENKGHMLDVNNAPVVPNDFVLIPEGTLYKYEDGYDNEQQKYIYKDIQLDSFYISKYEVTQFNFTRITGYNPSSHKGERLPVCCINLIDAINYCNKLSINEGYAGFYNVENNLVSFNPLGNGYRLPNKYEWAYAARGMSNRKTAYAAGNKIKDIAWYGGNSKETPHEVGTKQPNSIGIFDLNGNVREYLWEQDINTYNCAIGGYYDTFIGFSEDDTWGVGNCREVGIRLVLIPRGLKNENIDSTIKVKCWSKESKMLWAIGHYVDGLAPANKPGWEGGYGYMNKNQEFVTPRIYNYAWEFSHGRGLVLLNSKYGYYDSNGNLIISLQYDNANSFSEGLACVSKNGKYGFIDVNNDVVIPFVYDYAHSFSEGLAYACKDGKAGFIDKDDNVIIPFIYDVNHNCPKFRNGLVQIKHNYKGYTWIEIDKQGNIVSMSYY